MARTALLLALWTTLATALSTASPWQGDHIPNPLHDERVASLIVVGDLTTYPHLFLAALRSIRTQTMPEGVTGLDVVVVDTGAAASPAIVPSAETEWDVGGLEGPPSPRLPPHARSQYIHLPHASIGDARQEGAEAARGGVAIVWDLLAVYAPGRLAQQLAPILAGQVNVCIFFWFGACAGAAVSVCVFRWAL